MGKIILVMLVYGEYYGRVYEVYNKVSYQPDPGMSGC